MYCVAKPFQFQARWVHSLGILEPPAQSADIVLSLFSFFHSPLSPPPRVLSSSLPPSAPHPPHPPKPLSPLSPQSPCLCLSLSLYLSLSLSLSPVSPSLSVSLSPSCPLPSTEKGHPYANLSTGGPILSLSLSLPLSLSRSLPVSLSLSLHCSVTSPRSCLDVQALPLHDPELSSHYWLSS